MVAILPKTFPFFFCHEICEAHSGVETIFDVVGRAREYYSNIAFT
jgi:hypothetical protein